MAEGSAIDVSQPDIVMRVAEDGGAGSDLHTDHSMAVQDDTTLPSLEAIHDTRSIGYHGGDHAHVGSVSAPGSISMPANEASASHMDTDDGATGVHHASLDHLRHSHTDSDHQMHEHVPHSGMPPQQSEAESQHVHATHTVTKQEPVDVHSGPDDLAIHDLGQSSGSLLSPQHGPSHPLDHSLHHSHQQAESSSHLDTAHGDAVDDEEDDGEGVQDASSSAHDHHQHHTGYASTNGSHAHLHHSEADPLDGAALSSLADVHALMASDRGGDLSADVSMVDDGTQGHDDMSIKDILLQRSGGRNKLTRRRKRGPKPANSAFSFFRTDVLGEICEQHPAATPEETMALLEQRWTSLPDEQKQMYEQRSLEDDHRYEDEVKLYLPKSQGGMMKRKKARKHPSAPKHPMSAYLYFVADHRAKLKDAFPDKNFTEIAKLLGEQWRSIDPAMKAAYEQRASVDKERYKIEKDSFVPPPPEEPKRDDRRKKKHPLAPKHPLSAYLFFVATNRPKMNQEHPDKDFTTVAQMLGAQWKSLPPHARKKYDILAYADKKRYVEEKEKWVPPIDKKPLDSKKKPSGKAKTAYALWSAQERAQLTQTHPDIDKREATKLIRDKWRMIPEEHKAMYMEAADKDKQAELQQYEESVLQSQMYQQPSPQGHPQSSSSHQHHQHAHMQHHNQHLQHHQQQQQHMQHAQSPHGTQQQMRPQPPPPPSDAGGDEVGKKRKRKSQPSTEVLSWTAQDIGRFVASLGLPEHKDKFVRSGITGETFLKLTSPMLRDNYQIANIGDRKKIIKGISDLVTK